jgi:prepilin peptidase CpaA
MFGKTEWWTLAIVGISVLAILTDLLVGRIPNLLTFPAMILGLGLHVLGMGPPHASPWNGIWGLLLGLGAFGLLHLFSVMAAGDVKLVMALGSLGGPAWILDVMMLSILLGSLLALGILISQRKLGNFFTKSFRFLRSVFVPLLKVEWIDVDQKSTMPLGVAIGSASIWCATWGEPFTRWGVRWWT